MLYAIKAAAVGVLIAAACIDIRRRRISNSLVVAVAAIALVRLLTVGDLGTAAYTIAAATAVFAGGFLLFWRGLIGGGDVKLAAAAVLLVGHHALTGFLLAMSVAGLVVTLATVIMARLMPRLAAAPRAALPGPDEEMARPTVPYGVAIAAAGILMLLLQSPIAG